MNKKLFAVAFVCCSFFVFASNLYAKSKTETKTEEQTQSFSISTDPSDIKLTDSVPQNPVYNQKTPSTIWLFVKMIFALALIAGIAYGVFYLMKKNVKARNDSDPFLRNVSQITLSPGKTINVITLQNTAYLIGVTDNNINLLGQVQDEQLINAMNLYSDQNNTVSKPKSFSEILEIFMPGSKNSQKQNIFQNESQSAADLIKNQRNRLNTEE